jgi:hypothetical protein
MPPYLQPTARRTFRWLLTWLGTVAICRLALPYVAGLRAGLLEDDSYFYAQLAYNFSQHRSFTFDGIHATSGFHVLWGLVLSAISTLIAFITSDKAIHLSAHLATWLCVVFGIGQRIGRLPAQRWAFVGLALLTAPLMETGLLTLLLVVLFQRLTSSEHGPSRVQFDWAIVALSMAVPLTRIDATPIALLWMVTLGPQPKRAAAMALGVGLGVSSHLAFLMFFFGHPYTVSALLKTQSVGILSVGRSLSDAGVLVRTAVTATLVMWGVLRLRARRADRSAWVRFGAPVAFTVGHLLLSDMRSWYFLPGISFAFWAAATDPTVVAGWKGQGSRYLARVVYGASLVLTLYKGYRFVPLAHVRAESWKFVRTAREILPLEARIYQIDGSGFTGYWIARHLVNGDGLVNTYRYARQMKARRLRNYLVENSICYVITDAPVSNAPNALLVSKGGLNVPRSSAQELLRSGAYGWSRNPNAHFILWRLTADRCRSHEAVAAN